MSQDPLSSKERTPRLDVTFESLTPRKRQWSAGFVLGSDEANAEAALRTAWMHNSRIVKVQHG